MSLKELFRQKKITQEGICLELKDRFCVYKYQQQISDWIKGVRLIDLQSAYYISKILNVDMSLVAEASMRSVGLIK